MIKILSVLWGGVFGAAILNLGSLALIARSLPLTEFGVLSMMQSLIFALARFFNLNSSAVLHHFFDDKMSKADKNSLYISCQVLDYCVSVVLFVPIFIFFKVVGLQNIGIPDDDSYQWLWLLMFLFVIRNSEVSSSYLLIGEYHKVVAWRGFQTALIKLILFSAIFFYSPINKILYFILAIIVSELYFHSYTIYSTYRKHQITVRDLRNFSINSFRLYKRFFRLSSLSYIDGFIHSAREIDVYLIGVLSNEGISAIYKVFKSVIAIPARAVSVFQKVIMARLSVFSKETRHREGIGYFKRVAAWAACGLSFMGLSNLVLGEEILTLILPEEYGEIHNMLYFGMMALFFYLVGSVFSSIFITSGMFRENLVCHLLAVISAYIILLLSPEHTIFVISIFYSSIFVFWTLYCAVYYKRTFE